MTAAPTSPPPSKTTNSKSVKCKKKSCDQDHLTSIVPSLKNVKGDMNNDYCYQSD